MKQMNDVYEEYAQDKIMDFEEMKLEIIQKFVMGELNEADLKASLKRIFDVGHYVGHCRAESYCKGLYKQGFYDQL